MLKLLYLLVFADLACRVHYTGQNLNGDYKMKNLITAALVSLAFAGTAAADNIYIDVGADYGGNNTNTAAGNTTTGWKHTLALAYESNSVVQDVDGNQALSAGDTIVSSGGLIGAAILGNNSVTGLLASGFGGGPSDNGYGNNWALSFRFNDLMGTHNGTDFIYTSGNIDWFILDTSNGYGNGGNGTEVHLFTTTVNHHSSVPGNQQFTGTLGNFGVGSVNGVAAGDVFNIQYGSGSMSLEQYALQFVSGVRFSIDQNTHAPQVDSYDPQTGEFMVSGSHKAALEFQVPEPTTLAILGLGLLGFAGASRRKS